MNDFRYRKKNRKMNNWGFYVAFGICLIAVGLAVWTTYDSVVQYTNPSSEEENDGYSQISQVMETQKEVGNVKMKTPDETKRDTSSVSSQFANERPTISSQTSESVAQEQIMQEIKEESIEDIEEQDAAEVPPPDVGFVKPLNGAIYKTYSAQELVYSETMRDWRVHMGVDFAADLGDTVRSIEGGTVKDIYSDEMLGNVMLIESEHMQIYYCGLGETALAQVGETVTAGQDIGSVGYVTCESVETPHIHVEVKRDGDYIDPMSLFSEP